MASTTSSMPPADDALDELVDAEVLGPNAFERREAAAEDMIAAGEQARAVERPQVGHLLDHAQHLVVALGVLQMCTGREVSTLPQTEQVESLSATCTSAASSGWSAVSRFFIR